MSDQPHSPGDNVVPMQPKAADGRESVTNSFAAAGSREDPRMKEALQLMQAFLAIEDAPGRAALITLAERLVSDDWSRQRQQR